MGETHHWASHARLERWLDLLLQKLPEVNMLPKKRVFLDIIGAVDTQSACRVTSQETSEDAARLRTNFRAKDERVAKNFLVHRVCGLWVL